MEKKNLIGNKYFFKINHIFSEDAFKLSIEKFRFKNKKAFCINEILYRSGCEIKELLQLTDNNLDEYDKKYFLTIRISKFAISRIRIPCMVHKILKKTSKEPYKLFPFDNSKKLKDYLKYCYRKHKVCWIHPQYWKQFKAIRILRENGFKDPVTSLQKADSKTKFVEFLTNLFANRSYDKLFILKKFIFQNNMRIFSKSERGKYAFLFALFSNNIIEVGTEGVFSRSAIESLKQKFSEENDESKKVRTNNLQSRSQVLESTTDAKFNLSVSPIKNDISMDLKVNADNDFNDAGNKSYINKNNSLGLKMEVNE